MYIYCSVIPLDLEEGTLMGNSLRSFNLLRLKTIIEQRNQAAITFDSAAAAAAAAASAAEAEEAKVGWSMDFCPQELSPNRILA